MTKINQAEKMDQASQRDSSGSNSSNNEAHGGSSKTSGSKHRSENSSKDPTALFVVSSTTQDSALWGGLVHCEADEPKTATVSVLLLSVDIRDKFISSKKQKLWLPNIALVPCSPC